MVEHLPQVWVRPDAMHAIFTLGVPATGHVAECFAEIACVNRLDVDSFATRGILSSEQDPAAFTVLAEVCVPPVDVPTPPVVVLLTAQMEVVFACGTDASAQPDGTIQIYGADPGLVVLTVEQFKTQLNRKLIRGTAIRRLHLQRRGSDGTWPPVP